MFKRQKKIYLFYTLLPVLLFAEVLIFYYTDPAREWQEMLWFLLAIVLIVEVIIIPIQLVTKILFWRQMKGMSEAEKISFQKKPLSFGSILVNDLFVIEYRMFSKKVIRISEIFRAKYKEDKYNGHAGAISVSFVNRKIVLLRKGKDQIVMKSPKSFMGQGADAIIKSINRVIDGETVSEGTINYYHNCDREYPFYGAFFLVLLGLILFLYRCYLPLMNLFIDAEDDIEYFLFHVGFDKCFQVGAIIVICAYVIGSFGWKYIHIGIDFHSLAANFFIPFGIVLLLYLRIAFVTDYGDISSQARKDFVNYKKENYEYITTRFINVESYYRKTRNEWLKAMTTEHGLVIQACKSEDKNMEYILIGEDLAVQEDQEYQIVYLENTGLIVEIR